MNNFKRELDKARTEGNLKVLFDVVGKAISGNTEDITNELREKVVAKQEELTENDDDDIDFDFEFLPVKIEQEVLEKVEELRLLEEEYTPEEIFRLAGHRVYYNRKLFENTPGEREGDPIWSQAAQGYQTDITGEVNCIMYLKKPKLPDYEATFQHLEKLAKAKACNNSNMTDCLVRIASYFEGFHPNTFVKMDANAIAKMLLRSQTKINKRCYYRQQLESEVRMKDEPLLNAFTRAESLINQIYPGDTEEESKRNLLLQTLVRDLSWSWLFLSFYRDQGVTL